MDPATFLVQCLNALQYGLLLFLVASGLTLIFGVMGVINLAHGSFYMVGAYMAYALAPAFGGFAGWGFAHLPGEWQERILPPAIPDDQSAGSECAQRLSTETTLRHTGVTAVSNARRMAPRQPTPHGRGRQT